MKNKLIKAFRKVLEQDTTKYSDISIDGNSKCSLSGNFPITIYNDLKYKGYIIFYGLVSEDITEAEFNSLLLYAKEILEKLWTKHKEIKMLKYYQEIDEFLNKK